MPVAAQENAEQVSVVEPVEQVSEQQEVVSKAATFTQEALNKAIADALEAKGKEWQSSKDKEFAELQNKAVELEKRAEENALAALEQREIDTLGDSPEVKDLQKQRRNMLERETQAKRRMAEAEALANRANMTNRMVEAKEIAGAHPGIDVEDLLRCKTPEEMQGLVTIYDKIVKGVRKEKPVQKIDSAVPNVHGVSIADMTPAEAIKFALETQKKN